MSRLLLVGVLFVLAGLCEIGGGYLVWGWMRDNKPLLWALVGAVVLALLEPGDISPGRLDGPGGVHAANADLGFAQAKAHEAHQIG